MLVDAHCKCFLAGRRGHSLIGSSVFSLARGVVSLGPRLLVMLHLCALKVLKDKQMTTWNLSQTTHMRFSGGRMCLPPFAEQIWN